MMRKNTNSCRMSDSLQERRDVGAAFPYLINVKGTQKNCLYILFDLLGDDDIHVWRIPDKLYSLRSTLATGSYGTNILSTKEKQS